MRTTLEIDDAILEAARMTSDQTHQSLGKVISEWARRGLTAPLKIGRGDGFPTFSVPSDAPLINPEKIKQLIRDEGLSTGH